MASRNIKTQYAKAKWLAGDGVSIATHTLANTMAIPIGSVIKGVTLRAAVAAASSGSATLAINVGGIIAQAAVSVDKIDTAGWVYSTLGNQDIANVTTTNAEIGITVAGAVFTGSVSDIDIIIEYFLVD